MPPGITYAPLQVLTQLDAHKLTGVWNVLCIDDICRHDVLFRERSGERGYLTILDPYIADAMKEESAAHCGKDYTPSLT